MTSQIAAICGAPGSGKSSVCRALASQLNGEIVYMDAAAAYTTMTPEELGNWIEAGADYNVFDLPELAEQLSIKRQGTRPTFFESHFGRAHRQTGQHIGQQIYLQLPLEIALARQLEKICAEMISYGAAEMGQLQWFKGFLQSYQTTVAPLLASQTEQLLANADLVVDANRPLQVVTAEIAEFLRNKL